LTDTAEKQEMADAELTSAWQRFGQPGEFWP
jgi:hypothetical protein